MDQKILHAYESRCVQEEPPGCTTHCPLHVDVRSLLRHVAASKWADAWKVLRKTMPFPGILARICDAPCRVQCKRGEIDTPIQIGLIERAVVMQPPPESGRKLPMPTRNQHVGVLGGGVSSLTVALDVARKGYGVTILVPENHLSESLLRTYPNLKKEVIEAETALLMQLGVTIRSDVDMNAINTSEQHLLREYASIYLGLDTITCPEWMQPQKSSANNDDRYGFQMTGREGVFAGGGGGAKTLSPVRQAAEGRWAATSISRYLQKVSMTAGRDKEGPYKSRLYVQIKGIEPVSEIIPDDIEQGYTHTQAQQEADRCIQCECRECVKACVYLEHFKAYPKKYAREIYNNATVIMGRRQANTLVNSCSLCGLCEILCPLDFSMATLCLDARQELVQKGHMPPSAHDFALQDLVFCQSDRFSLGRHAPECQTSHWIFFPGCQLCASAPVQVVNLYDHLRSTVSEKMGLMLGCCAAPAYWAGRQDLFQKACSEFEQKWKTMGAPGIIVACSTCHQIFSEFLPQIPVTSLWKIIHDNGLPPLGLKRDPEKTWVLHDPCTSRHLPAVQSTVRAIAGKIGLQLANLDLSRDKTECCGFGGLMQVANPTLAEDSIHRRANCTPNDMVTYCAMCRDNLAATGKPVLHLLDFFWPETPDAHPTLRPSPHWSQRRENREWLKQYLLAKLWPDGGVTPKKAHQHLKLLLAPELAATLNRRRILIEDIQQVIHYAETSGRKFVHQKTGDFLAAFRPGNTTFWVAYKPQEKGYTVSNAYAHRIEVGTL